MTECKTYTLRDLEFDDIFLVTAVLSKIGIAELKDCMNAPDVRSAIRSASQGGEVDVSSVGVTVMMEIASVIIRNIGCCKGEIYTLLSALSGMTVDEIAHLPFKTSVKMVKDVITKPEFADFFTDAFGSQNSET